MRRVYQERGRYRKGSVVQLATRKVFPYPEAMEVHFTPDLEEKLKELAAQSGRGTDELVQDALAGYFAELVQTRDMLDSRYDELKSGKVKAIDGEEFFESLRRREDELLKKRSPE
jgi:hypothetical protein